MDRSEMGAKSQYCTEISCFRNVGSVRDPDAAAANRVWDWEKMTGDRGNE